MGYYDYVLERKSVQEDVPTRRVWYHKDCWDGFGSAYSAWKLFGDDAIYEPVSHGSDPPEFEDGDEIYILDFSYDRDTLLSIEKRASKIVVLDHHESARKELEDLPFAEFDMNKSGAVLSWEYFRPDDEIPELLLYVQDRDLWRWGMPHSREINYALRTYPFDFVLWDYFAFDNYPLDGSSALEDIPSPQGIGVDPPMEILKREGAIVVRMVDAMIDEAVQSAIEVTLDGQKIMAVNSNLLRSEIADRLIQDGSPIAATFSDGPKGRLWSLRSRDDEHDVSVIASKYGGGGHKQASGFREEKPGQHVKIENQRLEGRPLDECGFSVFGFPASV